VSLTPHSPPYCLKYLPEALGQVLAPLSPFAMPVFLAMSAWGILSKFEKWAQGTAPPPN
jgi:hypothetical protein